MNSSNGTSGAVVTVAVIVALVGAGAIVAGNSGGAEARGGVSIIPAGVEIEIKTAEGEVVEYERNGKIELEAGKKYSYKTADGEEGEFTAPEEGRVAALCFEGDYTSADEEFLAISGGAGVCMNNGGGEVLVTADEDDGGIEEEMEAALEAGENDENNGEGE